MNFTGITIAIVTFFVIGVFHPIVIKSEYHFGTRCWWVFAVLGVAFIVASLWVEHGILSLVLGVLGCSCLWSILELFEQKKRVERKDGSLKNPAFFMPRMRHRGDAYPRAIHLARAIIDYQ